MDAHDLYPIESFVDLPQITRQYAWCIRSKKR